MARRTDVLRVECGGERGTGILLDGTHVLTALHVIGRVEGGELQLHGLVNLRGWIEEGGASRTPTTTATRDDVVDFDSDLDWACLRGEGLERLPVLPVREVTRDDQNADWSTYGFPDTAPIEGKAAAGTVTSTAAGLRIGGVSRSAVQLFSREAGAGGRPGGFSGGPVVIGGHLVAMLCAAQLAADGAPHEGTLYAIPVAPIWNRLLGGRAVTSPPHVRVRDLVVVDQPGPGLVAAAGLLTDDRDALVAAAASWNEKLARDPLRTDAERSRLRAGSLQLVFDDPELRRELLDRYLATTSFSLYVYFSSVPDDRVVSSLLFERLRTKGRPISRLHARRDLAPEIAAAVELVRTTDHRTVPPPELVRGTRPLFELADGLLGIIVRRLAAPDSAAARREIPFIQTHLHLVKNIVTGQVHRRERNPL